MIKLGAERTQKLHMAFFTDSLYSLVRITYEGYLVYPTNMADTEIEGDDTVDEICEELRLEPQLQHNWWATLDSDEIYGTKNNTSISLIIDESDALFWIYGPFRSLAI